VAKKTNPAKRKRVGSSRGIKEHKLPATGNVLLCGKKQEHGKTILWVIKAPKLKAQAVTYEEAEELLLKKIWEQYDLDEPVGLKYEELSSGVATDLFQIAPNEVDDARDPGRFFKDGFCSVCQIGQSGRNGEILCVEHGPRPSWPGVLVRFQPALKCGMRTGMLLFHTHICERIKEVCDPLVEFREVRTISKRLIPFCEVIPTKSIPHVVRMERKGRIGDVCCKCGAECIYQERRADISKEDADLIRKHGAAAIGREWSPSFCMTATVWKAISRLKLSEGLLTEEIGELREDAINRKPKLGKMTGFKF